MPDPRRVVVCPKGHAHGPFNGSREALIALNEMAAEHFCGSGPYSVQHYEPISNFFALGDIPEHLNVSLGEPVRSRRHLKQLQKKYGCHDYEPIKERTAMYLGDRNPEIRRAKEAQAAAAALGDERARTKFRDDPAESLVFNGGD